MCTCASCISTSVLVLLGLNQYLFHCNYYNYYSQYTVAYNRRHILSFITFASIYKKVSRKKLITLVLELVAYTDADVQIYLQKKPE